MSKKDTLVKILLWVSITLTAIILYTDPSDPFWIVYALAGLMSYAKLRRMN